MKFIRVTDFVVQSILLLAAIGFGIIDSFNNNVSILFGIQFLMGCEQMASSLISILVTGPYFKQKMRHFVIAILYLTSLCVLHGALGETALLLYLLLPPWSLAVYYYFLTYKRLMLKTKEGNFLPHLNF